MNRLFRPQIHGDSRGPRERPRPPVHAQSAADADRARGVGRAAAADGSRREAERALRDRAVASGNAALQIENASYRTATGELTSQIQSLEGVIDELGNRADLDPAAARAMSKLPAAVRQRATGGPVESAPLSSASSVFSTSLASPEDTFGALRNLLQGLESRLNFVRRDVDRRVQLANATPSIWPTHGGLTRFFGGRSDPLTGEPAYHSGIDISAEKGQPVYATADGAVQSAGVHGRLRQPDCPQARVRPFNALRPSLRVSREGRRHGEPRRRHRLHRLDWPVDRLAPALRNPRQRAAHEPVAAPHRKPR